MNPAAQPSASSPDDREIASTALAWLLEREEGFSPDRNEEFVRWCAEDPRHARAVARAERGLGLLQQLPAVRSTIEARLATPPHASGSSSNVSYFPRRLALWCSGIAAALVLGALVFWAQRFGGSATTYATSGAIQRQLALPDGSILDLNRHTELSVRQTAHERRIELRSGEAFFNVAHDGSRPFVVSVDGVRVRAVGTAFSVRRSPDGIAVVVAEGRVEITSSESSAASGGAVGAPTVGLGERAWLPRSASHAAPQVEKLAPRELRAALAWQAPEVDGAGRPLGEIVREFNRHNRTQITIGDPAIAARRIGGSFAPEGVEALIRLLEQEGDIVVQRRSSDDIVLRIRP
jgi:transmembrane sensor